MFYEGNEKYDVICSLHSDPESCSIRRTGAIGVLILSRQQLEKIWPCGIENFPLNKWTLWFDCGVISNTTDSHYSSLRGGCRKWTERGDSSVTKRKLQDTRFSLVNRRKRKLKSVHSHWPVSLFSSLVSEFYFEDRPWSHDGHRPFCSPRDWNASFRIMWLWALMISATSLILFTQLISLEHLAYLLG